MGRFHYWLHTTTVTKHRWCFNAPQDGPYGLFYCFSVTRFTPTKAVFYLRCMFTITQEGGNFGAKSAQNGAF